VIGFWSAAACCRFPFGQLAGRTVEGGSYGREQARGRKAATSCRTQEPDHRAAGLWFTRSPHHRINRSRALCLIAASLLLSSAVANGSADSLEEYVHQFESSYQTVRTIRADFTQTYVSGGRTRIESGVVYFARGGLMRWDYQRPEAKLFLSDAKTLLLYIPEEKQLTRSPVKASDDIRIPFRLLLSRLDLHRVFSRLEFAPDALEHQPADRVLRAYPKKGFEDDYNQVLMVVSPEFDIRRLFIIFPDQSTMDFSFDHIARNVPLSPALFRFTPPPGAEVIDER
jgi:outer membrane lipoprotein carrier protein